MSFRDRMFLQDYQAMLAISDARKAQNEKVRARCIANQELCSLSGRLVVAKPGSTGRSTSAISGSDQIFDYRLGQRGAAMNEASAFAGTDTKIRQSNARTVTSAPVHTPSSPPRLSGDWTLSSEALYELESIGGFNSGEEHPADTCMRYATLV